MGREKHIGYFVGRGFEDLEFWVPYMRLLEEGARVTVIGPEAGVEYSSKHGCLTATSEVAAAGVDSNELDGVVIPGGWAPDRIRRDRDVCRVVREVYEAGKVVGMICHGGSVGISAGIVRGHRATGAHGIKDDLVNAGAEWVDEPAFRDGNIVWGRVVEDIPAFMHELVLALRGETAAPGV
jgi:protease I